MTAARERTVPVRRVGPEGSRDDADVVAIEEPLELRVSGETLAVTMRTPGHDRELALGFLWSEGVIASLDDVSAMAHCGRPGTDGYGNTLEVTPAPGSRLVLPDERVRRGTIVTSACGVCGRRTVDDLLARCTPVASDAAMTPAAMTRAVESMRAMQPLFAVTGGCHGAGIASLDGVVERVFEDVGRHNAVDKLVGSLLLEGRLPASRAALVTTGRCGFEVAQKAIAAGIPMVLGVGAATSLAVETARRGALTLAGFVRGGSMVVYAGAERVVTAR